MHIDVLKGEIELEQIEFRMILDDWLTKRRFEDQSKALHHDALLHHRAGCSLITSDGIRLPTAVRNGFWCCDGRKILSAQNCRKTTNSGELFQGFSQPSC